MSTIASPRLPPSEVSTPTTSRRTSFDTNTRSGAASPARPTIPSRRNRAALQAYYGLKNNATNSSILEGGEEADVKVSELDNERFQAEEYVKRLLAKEGLEGILKVESELLNDIRYLDGERKALVYDNYSKLISATETIRKMRTNMDPLAPTTFTLAPAISHIAETATALASTSSASRAQQARDMTDEEREALDKKQRQQQTARWVLDTPRRLLELLDAKKIDEAESDWAEVRVPLEKWKQRQVKGAEELWLECQRIMAEDDEDEDDNSHDET